LSKIIFQSTSSHKEDINHELFNTNDVIDAIIGHQLQSDPWAIVVNEAEVHLFNLFLGNQLVQSK